MPGSIRIPWQRREWSYSLESARLRKSQNMTLIAAHSLLILPWTWMCCGGTGHGIRSSHIRVRSADILRRCAWATANRRALPALEP
jgi:hypothetical protein